MCCSQYYAGLDLHKRTISYCVKAADGTILDEGVMAARRNELADWAIKHGACITAMEATMFTGWVYDFLVERGVAVKVGHPYMLQAITAAKKKNDRVDARKLADLLRCDMFPESYMAPDWMRELRRVLRYRNMLMQEAVRMKNKTACLLMEVGGEYNKKRLHGKKYFVELLEELTEIPESVRMLLNLSHETMWLFEQRQRWLIDELTKHPALCERVERLMTIDGVGEVTALTWALEIGEPERFGSISAAVSYCGLCSAQDQSGGVNKRGPISKQRNKNLQRVLIEAAKLAPRWNPQLAAEYHKRRDRGANYNKATLAVARKLVAYLLAVDKSGKAFEQREVAA